MNQYEADISVLIKEMFPKDKPLDVGEILSMIHSGFQGMRNNPRVIADVGEGILRDSGTFPTPENIQSVLNNAPIQMLWELMNVLYGTSIYVKDVNLIEAMLNTEIDAQMGDVKFPFPVCEFVFPEHISLGIEDYDISGCVLGDVKSAPLNFLIGQSDIDWHIVCPDRVKMMFFTRLIRRGKADVAGVSWLHFDPSESLESIGHAVPLKATDSMAVHKLCKLCFGLCLYCQTTEGQKSLEKFELPRRAERKGSGPTEMRMYKNRNHYLMRDLITHTLREPGVGSGGTHASPKMHWRKLHLRTLRHERYARNPDGSLRAVWVRPTLVKPTALGIARGERKIQNEVVGSPV